MYFLLLGMIQQHGLVELYLIGSLHTLLKLLGCKLLAVQFLSFVLLQVKKKFFSLFDRDYPEVAKKVITEMHRQVGDLVFNENGKKYCNCFSLTFTGIIFYIYLFFLIVFRPSKAGPACPPSGDARGVRHHQMEEQYSIFPSFFLLSAL